MSASILSFFTVAKIPADWSNEELAELYRVEAALGQAGIAVETDRGMTDEGDPWFIFCRSETVEVIVHFAKCDGCYLAASPLFRGTLRGRNFHELVRQLLETQPLRLPTARISNDGNLYMHPAVLLTAFVATAFLSMNDDREVGEQGLAARDLDPLPGRLEDSARLYQAGRAASSDLKSVISEHHGAASYGSIVTAITAALMLVEQDSIQVITADSGLALDAREVGAGSTGEGNPARYAEASEGTGNRNIQYAFSDDASPTIDATIITSNPDQVKAPARGDTSKSDASDGQTTATDGDQAKDLSIATAEHLESASELNDRLSQPALEITPNFVAARHLETVNETSAGYSGGNQAETNAGPEPGFDRVAIEPARKFVSQFSDIFGATSTDHEIIVVRATGSDSFKGLSEVVENPQSEAVLRSLFSENGVETIRAETIEPTNAQTFDTAANALIQAFLLGSKDAKLILSGSDLVIFDAGHDAARDGLVSIETWSYSDGSTISIVGIIPDDDAASLLMAV